MAVGREGDEEDEGESDDEGNEGEAAVGLAGASDPRGSVRDPVGGVSMDPDAESVSTRLTILSHHLILFLAFFFQSSFCQYTVSVWRASRAGR